jgi:hypothetical protein
MEKYDLKMDECKKSQINAPKIIKMDMNMDKSKGDIPLNIYPDIPMIKSSKYNSICPFDKSTWKPCPLPSHISYK